MYEFQNLFIYDCAGVLARNCHMPGHQYRDNVASGERNL